jgi:ribosomal RNA-processing protein 7
MSETISIMENEKPNSLASYTILAASLPTVASFPTPATHYMYLRKDSPTVSFPDTPRSIFIANIPIDATEKTLRTFFKQISGARVDRVDFEEDLAKAQVREQAILVKGQRWDDKVARQNGKKRKREEDEEVVSTLPETWSVKTRKSGENAVVVFVDKATADAVLKECRTLTKKNKTVPWIQVEELGLNRKRVLATGQQVDMLTVMD